MLQIVFDLEFELCASLFSLSAEDRLGSIAHFFVFLVLLQVAELFQDLALDLIELNQFGRLRRLDFDANF